MTGAIDMVILGFIIGLTGALAPGPTLVAAINASVRSGWTAGPKITLGHILVEIFIILLIIAGFSFVLSGYSSLIAMIGGVALVVFGAMTILSSRNVRIDNPGTDGPHTTPVLAGFLTSIGNPYFWIWWLTIGSALLIGASQGGFIMISAFIAGHWGADLSWYTLVSASIHQGRFFLKERDYRFVLAACGIFLMAFGIYYLSTVFF